MKISAVLAINQNNVLHLNLFVLFVASVVHARGNASPWFSLRSETFFSEPQKNIPGPEKKYTGIRVSDNSELVIFEHAQTLAVVEMDPSKTKCLSCELLEVRTERDKLYTLKNLTEVTNDLNHLEFNEMIRLMKICENLDLPTGFLTEEFIQKEHEDSVQRRNERTNFEVFTIFKGIVPGTKWCGLGDKAGSYHDLGSNVPLDKCCRTHDLCPIKILGFTKHYGILNYSYSTRSHCKCDEEFYYCLKSLNTTISNIVGNIFFGSITCLESDNVDDPEKSKIMFVKKDLHY